MRPRRPADSVSDPALDAELEEIARRLRAEFGTAPSHPERPGRSPMPATVRFFAALVIPGLVLLGVGALFGTG
jgi:hypothetical protein